MFSQKQSLFFNILEKPNQTMAGWFIYRGIHKNSGKTAKMTQKKKPVVYWVLQDNQVTANLIDFFELIKLRVKEFLTLKFMVPEISSQTLEMTQKLKPEVFRISSGNKPNSYEGYCRKKDQLGDNEFSDGLKFWQALLLDDLGSGHLFQTQIHAPSENNVSGVVIQIPTPLGSSDNEERIFYAWTHLAKINKVPIVGYELMSLATRWTLAPSLVDGIITTRKESYDYLTGPDADLDNKVWRIPDFERCFFSPATHPLWRKGLGSRHQRPDISAEKTILYIAHNVAMTYEYKDLLRHLSGMADRVHLMFSYGQDQVRGSHTHQQIIETVCKDQLPGFSYTFHDMNQPAQITMADAVVACADCYCTEISSAIGVPTIIFDPLVPETTQGHKIWTRDKEKLTWLVNTIITRHNEATELSYVLIDIARRNLPPWNRKGQANG